MKKTINRIILFIGWILSPFTVWNDAFVNIPIAYISARFLAYFIPVKFVLLVLICYWISNVVGLAMMYMGGKKLIRAKGDILREVLNFLLTITIYSIILVLAIYILRSYNISYVNLIGRRI